MKYVRKMENVLSPEESASSKRKASHDLHQSHKRRATKSVNHKTSPQASGSEMKTADVRGTSKERDGDDAVKGVESEPSDVDKLTTPAPAEPISLAKIEEHGLAQKRMTNIQKVQHYLGRANDLVDTVSDSEAEVVGEEIAEVQDDVDDMTNSDKRAEELKKARQGKRKAINNEKTVPKPQSKVPKGTTTGVKSRREKLPNIKSGDAAPPPQPINTNPTSDARKPPSTASSLPPPIPTSKNPNQSRTESKPPSQQNTGDQSPSSEWLHTPNRLAHSLTKKHSPTPPAHLRQLLQSAVQEPEYALRDIEIRDALWALMTRVEKFAACFFSFVSISTSKSTSATTDLTTKNIALLRKTVYSKLQPATVRIVGCVASGGPKGADGWHELFLDARKRQALVCAVVGNVLVEQVFGSLFFGGEEWEVGEVEGVQEELKDDDGFNRNARYAETIRSILRKQGTPTNPKIDIFLPSNFTTHVHHILLSLWTHLSPLLALDATQSSLNSPTPLLHALLPIVVEAGLSSLHMRLDAHTAYYFQPVLKEDVFTGARMECFNDEEMRQQNPRTPDDDAALSAEEMRRREGLDEVEKRRRGGDEPVTRITIMQGVTAYRLGGWETEGSTARKRVFEEGCEGKGVRVRVLTQGWVYCRWGRARRFEKGIEVDGGVEVHGEGYKGFVEFEDVKGVPAPNPERTRRKKENTAAEEKSAEEEKTLTKKTRSKPPPPPPKTTKPKHTPSKPTKTTPPNPLKAKRIGNP